MAIDDILHLRQTGIWPGNAVPAWALAAARARGTRTDDAQALLDVVLAEVQAERQRWLPRVQALEAALQSAVNDQKGQEGAVRPALIARTAPPVGPLLLLAGNGGLVGVGRNTETGLVVLWSEPAGAQPDDFRWWISVSSLAGRAK